MESYKPRAYGVNDFLQWHRKRELVLQPRFQRREVWTGKARSYLIDTVLRELPIPLIFIRQDVNPSTHQTVREVVDGQQRLRAILDYIEGDFAVQAAHNREHARKHYGDLPESVQRRLLDYELSVVILVGATDADVLNVFARLNSYTEKLTPQELLNAEFSGAFKQTVYEMGFSHLAFWQKHKILSDRQIVRMAEAELTSELVIAMLDGLQDGKKSVRQFYERYDDQFPHGARVRRRFGRVIDELELAIGDVFASTVFRRKAMFYSLFCVTYDMLFGLPKSPTNPRGTKRVFTERTRREMRAALLSMDQRFESDDAKMAEFHRAAISQTDRIKPRQVRHKTIWGALS